ncbi:MAG: rRNA maturation RNase YbeY [Xanthomonadales bacterium]|nr:rRNA maturation RNase YbeY [Gammaproteobacteria bacterium]MBT8051306.1 rRNA maturation RNase YbeY [Gammaproteobacteria bacterium]NNJ79260.1 rRNA maturation RNase YbeY [Xanthomonadales bacterium]NNL03782.1 rRNA maturation RNase YbeY [Xanthomonadales bacterium]
MAIEVDLQFAGEWPGVPGEEDFRRWIVAALDDREDAELTVRVVGRAESRRLNRTYRQKDQETNVLSFPADLPEGVDLPLLGDIVVCAPLVAEEAAEQGKLVSAHWAHLTIHGVLHLLGHDHQVVDEAEQMEALEISLLSSLGIADPYA